MRYDLTDFEWSVIEPLLPTDRRGPKPQNNRRVLNGIFWVLRTGAPWRDLPERYGPYTTAYNRFNDTMTTEQKIIRAKVGLLELAKQLGNCQPSLQDDGLQPRQLLSLQGALRHGRRDGIAGDQPQEAGAEEPRVSGGRRRDRCARPRAAGIRTASCRQRIAEERACGLARRRALRVAAPRLGNHEETAESARSQERAGGLGADRSPAGRAGKGQDREGGPWRVRERASRGTAGAQDTFYVGNLEGVGRVYQQTFIDTYSKVACAKLYDRKTSITAADLLNDRVVPFFDSQEVKLLRVLTDRGSEYCGNPERHEYGLYLAVEDIDHSRTKTKSPHTNGICERFHKTVLNEFYRVAFRKKVYRSIDELQADLDLWMREYNEQRPHQGRWCFGKTPMQTFLDAMPMAKKMMIAA